MLDPKKTASAIISKLSPPAKPQGFAEGGEAGYHDEKEIIADDLIEGINAKDHAKVTMALEALCDLILAKDAELDVGGHQEPEGFEEE